MTLTPQMTMKMRRLIGFDTGAAIEKAQSPALAPKQMAAHRYYPTIFVTVNQMWSVTRIEPWKSFCALLVEAVVSCWTALSLQPQAHGTWHGTGAAAKTQF